MSQPTDITITGAAIHLLPVQTRMPIKFGAEVVTQVTCARVCVAVRDRQGGRAVGWGETPLSVQWAWPSTTTSYEQRHEAMIAFCCELAQTLVADGAWGHPLELGATFQQEVLPALCQRFNAELEGEPLPHLAALVCLSAIDVAVHDAYASCVGLPVYATYSRRFLNRDLADFLEPAGRFRGRFPDEFLTPKPPHELVAWHLVGGLDPLDESDLTGGEPDDGQPVMLPDWIKRDGLKALKVKLRGTDAAWDYQRLVRVGRIAMAHGVDWLSADFNCTVTDPAYVNDVLDRLLREQPRLYSMLLYVEQPFPYDLTAHRLDVRSVAARKPLFMDESAHDWRLVRLGRQRGWSGVALKTCKTQTGAILSLCWAKVHGMPLMVQDLANPMLAMIPHVQLAAHAGTIMGVETNASQFYPSASEPEAAVHPGLYRRRAGRVDWSTAAGRPGFGYRVEEIRRTLPEPVAVFGDLPLTTRTDAS